MLVSLGIFVVTSAACMVSPSIGWLIGARALQGFGAGILWPSLSTNALLVPSIFLGFLYFPQFLQKVLGWSVLESSFGMLPMMVLLSVGSIVSGRFYDSVGPKRLLLIGYAGITVGFAWVVALMPSWGYLALFPAMLLLGFGAALAVGSAGTVAVSAVAPERAGLAGALAFTVHLTLGAVGGTAIMYASSFSSLRQGLMASGIDMSPADQAAINAAASGSDAVREVFDKVGPATAETIHAILTGGFVDGLRHADWLALAAAIVGIVAVVALDERKLKNVGGGKS